MNENDNNFLDNLNNVNYQSEIKQQELIVENKKEMIITQREMDKQQRATEKQLKISQKELERQLKDEKKQIHYKNDDSEDDNLYSDKPTKLIGKDRMIIQHKINSYRELFKNELKGFKIKKNASTEELQECLNEMQHIIETGTVNQFLEDSIIQCIKIIEGISGKTKYNISGLADMLSMNKEFNSLTRQLFLKYGVFSKIPIEYQLVMIVSTTAYICKCKNDNRIELNNFFNEPILK